MWLSLVATPLLKKKKLLNVSPVKRLLVLGIVEDVKHASAREHDLPSVNWAIAQMLHVAYILIL